MAEISLLLIDGSKASRAIIAKTIESNLPNVSVTGFDTGAAALKRLQIGQFQLIITAMSLPDMQAQEFAENLRKTQEDFRTPIIMMSGDFMQNINNKTVSPYINGYFDKSRGNEKLVSYIQSYLSHEQWNKATKCHVLYVEDSPTVTRVVTNMLNQCGFTYQHTNNATDALKLLDKGLNQQDEQQAFDIMLTDLQLEGFMSGCDMIREIRFGLGLTPEIFPVLVSTSPNQDRIDQINGIIYAGANDIIEKPLVESLLIARMSNLIRLKQCTSPS